MSRLNISDVLGFLGGDLQVVTAGPITGTGVGLQTASVGQLPGFTIPLAPTRPSRALIHYQARFDNSAAAWNWVYSDVMVVGGAATKLKTHSELRAYYLNAGFGMNQGWDLVDMPAAGSYIFGVGAQSNSSSVQWSANPENYLIALMWPK